MTIKNKKKSIKTIVTFLIINILLSSFFYFLIGVTGSITGAEARFVYGLMWCPGIAALITSWIYNSNILGLGWKWGGWRYQLMSYLLPPLYTLVAYIPIWISGLGKFGNEDFLNKIIPEFGHIWQTVPQPLFILFFIIITGTTLFARSCSSALGEEIGWRGLLIPELSKITSFTNTALIGGIIWALWHFPLIIFVNYNADTLLWYSLSCFTVMVIGLNFLYTWMRLKTGSIWPTVFLHASHNLFIQGIFDPLTKNTGYTQYFIGEFGIALIIPITYIAVYCWVHRTKIQALT